LKYRNTSTPCAAIARGSAVGTADERKARPDETKNRIITCSEARIFVARRLSHLLAMAAFKLE
jgi:hypothetical protein